MEFAIISGDNCLHRCKAKSFREGGGCGTHFNTSMAISYDGYVKLPYSEAVSEEADTRE